MVSIRCSSYLSFTLERDNAISSSVYFFIQYFINLGRRGTGDINDKLPPFKTFIY